MDRSAFEASLPRAAYVDEAFLDMERERLWWAEWVAVGREEQLAGPGDFLSVDLAGERVIVVRTRAGGLSAHYDVCRHRGSRLTSADQRTEPRAATGRLTRRARSRASSAARTTRGATSSTARSATPRTSARPTASSRPTSASTPSPSTRGAAGSSSTPRPSGSPAGHTLAAQLGEIPARIARYPLADLRTARRIVYDVRANWKVIVENYNECYHCAGVHPELCRIVPAFREKGGAFLDWDNGVPQAEGTFTFTLTGTTDRAPFPGLDEHEQTRHKGELVYPNLMISLSADHVAAFTLVPKAPDRTLIVVDWLFHPDEMAKASFDPSDAVDFWDLVNRQDWTVCEGVQDGMTSRRFGFGWYAPMEDMSLDIRRYLAERMGDDAVRVDRGHATGPADATSAAAPGDRA